MLAYLLLSVTACFWNDSALGTKNWKHSNSLLLNAEMTLLSRKKCGRNQGSKKDSGNKKGF
jgi:hypothetical protein